MIWRIAAQWSALLTIVSDEATALLLQQQRQGVASPWGPAEELPIGFTASYVASPAPGPGPVAPPVLPVVAAPAPAAVVVPPPPVVLPAAAPAAAAPAPAVPTVPQAPLGVAPVAAAPAASVAVAPAVASSPPAMGNVDQALASALDTLKSSAQVVGDQEVALLNQSATNAMQAATMAVQADINQKLSAEMDAMAPTQQEFDEEKANILDEKKKEMQAKTEEVTASAEEIAKETVDDATGAHMLHSKDIVKKLESTEKEARDLSSEAVQAERLGDAASRSAIAWLEKLPIGAAMNISRLEKQAVHLALTLQSQAAEAGRIDKFVDKLVSQTKASADEADRIAANSTIAATEALEQATQNSRTVKEIEDLADQVSNTADTGMQQAATQANVAADAAAAASAQQAASQAQDQMKKQGVNPR